MNNKKERTYKKRLLPINNLGLKIIALLIAFLVWFMVVNGEDPVTTKKITDVKVEILNRETLVKANQVAKVLQDSNEVYTNVTTITVRGRRSVVSNLTADDFEVKADLKELQSEPYASVESVPIQVSVKSSDIKLEDDPVCTPSSLQVSIEDGQEQTFMVAVTTSKEATGYRVGGTSVVDYESVIVWGAQDVVSKIDKVTLPVDTSEMKESSTVTSSFVLYDKNGDVLSDSVMENLRIKSTDGTVITTAQANITIWKVYNNIKIEAESYGTPAAGYRVAEITTVPEVINLAGEEATMEELDGVLTIPEAVSVEGASASIEQTFDISEFIQENYKKQLLLEADAATQITIKVQLEKIGTTTLSFPVKKMTVKGAPEGMDISLTPNDNISIEIQPETVDMDTITVNDITAELNLTDYKEEGTYSVPVTITLPKGYTLVKEVEIAVNLKKTTTTTTTGEE